MREQSRTGCNSFVFKSFDVIETALYHQVGNLPEPEKEHKFYGYFF